MGLKAIKVFHFQKALHYKWKMQMQDDDDDEALTQKIKIEEEKIVNGTPHVLYIQFSL